MRTIHPSVEEETPSEPGLGSGEQRPSAELVPRRGFLAGAAAGGAGAILSAGQAGCAPVPSGSSVPLTARHFTFLGGAAGPWSVVESRSITGEPLPPVGRIDIVQGPLQSLPPGTAWRLRGVTSNERYATRAEKDQLVARQAALGRPEATSAALIPIRKSARWWSLTQDERRAVFEERSNHTKIGLKYLPAIARRLHHCRDLGEDEPFDFVTFFDYAPSEAKAFDEPLAALRASEEWKFVEREVELRLTRA
jgi:hypothetical protein